VGLGRVVRIYEWDSLHGAVEIYDKQGKRLGEFNLELVNRQSQQNLQEPPRNELTG
jgi:hypothetical protein